MLDSKITEKETSVKVRSNYSTIAATFPIQVTLNLTKIIGHCEEKMNIRIY